VQAHSSSTRFRCKYPLSSLAAENCIYQWAGKAIQLHKPGIGQTRFFQQTARQGSAGQSMYQEKRVHTGESAEIAQDVQGK
jgi:hypothetical protein